MEPAKSVAVIGAGPCGLAAARRLKEEGLDFTLYERRGNVGGIWFYQTFKSQDRIYGSDLFAPPSACYQALKTNLITPIMTFDAFPYPPGTPLFIPHDTVFKYLQGFQQHFDLEKSIELNTNVRRVSKSVTRGWKVELDRLFIDSEGDGSLMLDQDEKYFDAVVVCNGHYDKPDMPIITGLEKWLSRWPERVIHSRYYKKNTAFKDKVVLIVGSGVSAFDLGKDIAFVAREVYQAVRENLNDTREESEKLVERFVWSVIPGNMTQVAEATEFCDPIDVSDITFARVQLLNGEYIEGIDYVVLCTGYIYSFPFLDEISAAMEPQEDFRLVSNGAQVHNLFMEMFHIPNPTLAFIGIPRNITTFQLFDFQAISIASVLSGKSSLPAVESMRLSSRLNLEPHCFGKLTHSLGFEREIGYIRAVTSLIDTPKITKFSRVYENLVRYTQNNGLEISKHRLLNTTNFRGKSNAEVAEIVLAVIKKLELCLTRRGNGGVGDFE